MNPTAMAMAVRQWGWTPAEAQQQRVCIRCRSDVDMDEGLDLAMLLAAIEPFLAQDYNSDERRLDPGLPIGAWLDLEEAASALRNALDAQEYAISAICPSCWAELFPEDEA